MFLITIGLGLVVILLLAIRKRLDAIERALSTRPKRWVPFSEHDLNQQHQRVLDASKEAVELLEHHRARYGGKTLEAREFLQAKLSGEEMQHANTKARLERNLLSEMVKANALTESGAAMLTDAEREIMDRHIEIELQEIAAHHERKRAIEAEGV